LNSGEIEEVKELNMKDKNNNAIFLIQQVEDLEERTKSTIKTGDDALTYSLAMEYEKLINSAIGKTRANDELLHELFLLKAESATIPPKSKDDPLAQLRWVDNSISKLKMLVKRLAMVDTNLELKLHPRVLAVSDKLFKDEYYSQAIFEAFKSLEEYVKEKSGVKGKRGKQLMGHVFDESNPILKIKYSHPDTAKEEQEGFKLIFMGSMLGIRNPKAHYTITQLDEQRALQYLAFASLLFKAVDDATLT